MRSLPTAPRGGRPEGRSGIGTWAKRVTGVSAVIGIALASAGCAERPSAGAHSGSGPIRIGVSLPLTGDFSQPGSEARRGYELWEDHVNQNGGLLGRKVDLIVTDDASNQDTAVADYTRLITKEQVDLVLGTFSSLLNFPASAVAEKNGMVFVEPAGGAPDMFTRGFENLFFAQPAVSADQANTFADWVASLPAGQRPKTAAYTTMDDPFTKPVIDSLRPQLEALGVKTVYNTIYPADTTNFQSVASNIADKKPDLIAQGAQFEDGIGLVRALQQLDFSPRAMFQTSTPSNGSQYTDAVGIKNTEGAFYSVSWNEQADTPLNDEFVAAYHSEYDAAPSEDAADAFGAAQVLQTAVESVGSLDQEQIRDWLHANEVDTILGPLSWNEKGEPQGEYLLAQWQSGKVEIVLPESARSTGGVVYPKPVWQ